MSVTAPGIRVRLLAILILPVTASLILAGATTAQIVSDARRAHLVGRLAAAAPALSKLTSTLRQERSVSALASAGYRPARWQSLGPARSATDRAWAQFEDTTRAGDLRDLSAETVRMLDRLHQDHERMKEVRQAVDASIASGSGIANLYNPVLKVQIDFPRRIAESLPDRKQANALIAYAEAEAAVEQASQEQLTGTLILVAGTATVDQLRTMASALAAQDEALESLGVYGDPQLRQAAQDIISSDSNIAKLGNLRATFSFPSLLVSAQDIAPSSWSEPSGEHVDTLRRIARLAADQATAIATQAAAEATRRLLLEIVVTLLLTVLAIAVALWVARGIVRPLRELTAAANHVRKRLPTLAENVAQGEEWVYSELQTMSRNERGEIGQLARAFSAVNDVVYRVTIEQAELRASLQDLAERSQQQALHDPLTGLPNRAFFAQHLDEAIDAALATGHGPAVLLLDLDGFKAVNDTLGHHCGDLLLKECARRITDTLREDDVAARLGGDEFVVLLPAARDLDNAMDVAMRVAAAINLPYTLDDSPADVTASIGVAGWTHGDDGESLLRRSDEAMYRAKTAGGGVASEKTSIDAAPTGGIVAGTLHGDLRQAMSRSDPSLSVYLQPIVRLPDARVVRLEALSRWNHPRLGFVSPLDFIATAERHGLIRVLTEQIADEAVLVASRLLSDGTPVPVSINVSPSTVDMELVAMLQSTLEHHRLPAELFGVEVTETVAVSTDSCKQALQALRALGSGVSLDDFGAGYSNLARLSQLPIDHIKLDRSLVQNLGSTRLASAVIESTAMLARQMGCDLVAEGVETRKQAERLVDLGCDYAQGYFYSRAVPVSQLPSLLGTLGTADPRFSSSSRP